MSRAVRKARNVASEDGRGKKGARTRAQIKQAIVALLDERSLFQVKLEDVCERTGLTVGAFYFHFASKEAAMEEITMDFVTGFYGAMASAPVQTTLHGELSSVISIFVEATVERRTAFRLPYMILPTSVRVYEHWLDARAPVILRLASAIAHHRPGRRTPGGEDHLAAQFLLAGIEGFMENAFYGRDSLMKQIDLRRDALVRDLAGLWYRSIAGEEPRTAGARRKPAGAAAKPGR